MVSKTRSSEDSQTGYEPCIIHEFFVNNVLLCLLLHFEVNPYTKKHTSVLTRRPVTTRVGEGGGEERKRETIPTLVFRPERRTCVCCVRTQRERDDTYSHQNKPKCEVKQRLDVSCRPVESQDETVENLSFPSLSFDLYGRSDSYSRSPEGVPSLGASFLQDGLDGGTQVSQRPGDPQRGSENIK